jgi:hypothetical protein
MYFGSSHFRNIAGPVREIVLRAAFRAELWRKSGNNGEGAPIAHPVGLAAPRADILGKPFRGRMAAFGADPKIFIFVHFAVLSDIK